MLDTINIGRSVSREAIGENNGKSYSARLWALTHLGFLRTKTTTSLKVYKRRGYRCVTANSLLCLVLVVAQVISRSEVWYTFSRSSSKDPMRPLLACFSLRLSRAPSGFRSPPSSPSQPAYSIGLLEFDVRGSE